MQSKNGDNETFVRRKRLRDSSGCFILFSGEMQPFKAVGDISSVKTCELEITLLPLMQFVLNPCIWIDRKN